jgi:hypothetical protein
VDSISSLSHIISEAGVDIDLAKVQTIIDWPLPARHALFVPSSALWDATHKFMWDYGTITATHIALLHKDRFQWPEEATTMF